MPQRIEVPGQGIVEFPDGMTDAQISAALTKAAPAPAPSTGAVFKNALAKGAAGFGDMIGNGLVNVANLGIAGYGATKGALGSKDLPDLIPSDTLSGYEKAARAGGLIKDENAPQTGAQRLVDVAGQVVGGGGINPAAIVRAGARGAVLPIVRDAAAAGGTTLGNWGGGELVRNVDTGNETVDRLVKVLAPAAGGMAAGGATAARGTGGDRAAAALKGVTPEQLALADALAKKAAAAGTPITAYEAIQQVTGLNPKMQTQQRVTEQSDAAAGSLTPIMQNRPANNAALAERTIDAISPKEALPDVLAGKLKAAAQGGIDTARDAGNARAAPHYAASSNDPSVKIPSHDWNALATDPAIAWALEQTKKSPLLGVQGATEGSLQWLDAAKKFLDSKGQALAQTGDRFPAGQASAAAKRITQSVDPLVPEYAQARAVVADNLKNVVTPMEQSQVGKLARSDEFAQQAGALLPEKPLDVTPAVIDRTLGVLGGQDSTIGKRFIAQYLRGTFNESNGGGIGNNPAGGYNFAKKVADNPGQKENLIAALKASGANPAQMEEVLQIFQAQGFKPSVNSATAASMAEAGAQTGGLAGFLSRPLKAGQAAVDAFRNGAATKSLAKALSSKENTVQDMRDLARANGSYDPVQQQALINALLARNSATPAAGQ